MIYEEDAYIAEEIAKRRQQDRDEALAFMVSDHRGRSFLWDLLDQTGMFKASFTGDSLTTAFNEGKRHIGIATFADALLLRPHVFTEMQAEYAARSERYHVSPANNDGEYSHE